MSENYQQRKHDDMRKTADAAFEQLPAEGHVEARASREQLLTWLSEVEAVYQDVADAFTDTEADVTCSAFERVLTELVETANRTEFGPMLQAWLAMEDDTVLDLMRNFLGVAMRSLTTHAMLVTQQREIESHGYVSVGGMWEQTGVHIDNDAQVVFAKQGERPYQPIGFDNGDEYVSTEGSKLFWQRNFGLALVLPFHPAFLINPVDAEVSDTLTPTELTRIHSQLTQMEGDLTTHGKLRAKDATLEHEDKMRLGLDMARIQLPRLDKTMTKIYEDNPEVGEKFEHVDIVQVTCACVEFLRMALDENHVTGEMQRVVLSCTNPEENYRKRLECTITTVQRRIADTSGTMLSRAYDTMGMLSSVATRFPEAGAVLGELDPSTTLDEAAATALDWLVTRAEACRSGEYVYGAS